jgi:uncharacterized protein (DUF1778 family)
MALQCSYIVDRMATKDDVIRMRVSADQKRAIVAAAEREGLEVSQWLRQLALRAAGVLPETKRRKG